MADGRFAPSPTADLHLGNLRTALVAWLFARSAGSRFALRMEDLDPAASPATIGPRQLDDLAQLGLDWDGPVLYQRDRRSAYEEVIDGLVAEGRTYLCYCTRREIREATVAPHGPSPDGAYPGTCRDLGSRARAEREAEGRRGAVRLRADAVELEVVDRQCGPVKAIVDDFVLRRNDGVPAYNLAVVVDDHHQRVAEVVRGDDLLLSTPRQVHLARLLGYPDVSYAHVPLVLGPDGDRLAKRDGAVTWPDRRARGESPAQIRGALAASLGLIPVGDELEDIDLSTLVDRFDPTRLSRSPWIFRPG
jgi:glutamyl-tRNA synthetase